ncbi:MAG: substrate-binding domain-containing protein [Ruminiclostridium sp.]|nr:substrate-binding domain-containing protein [Ruminiclostridium sp.]
MSLRKKITFIIALVLCFVLFDLSVYNIFTKRYINNTSKVMQAKSIELEKYLPFDENSELVKINSSLKLEGDLPVVDGAAALYPVFSAFVDSVYPKDSISFENGSFSEESKLQYTNTKGAYKSVVDGTADVVFCVKPSEEQAAYAREKGVELEFVPIGYEAFVFIVNKNNPVDNLTTEQVRDIYSGKITNLSEVGGNNRTIDALQRNEGSGSQTAMLGFMGDVPMKRNILMSLTGSAIGFSFRYYVEGIVENSDIKMLSLDGAYPDKENISNGSYPVVSSLYAVYDKANDNPNIPILIEWILSEEGQEIVEKSGYVPVG